MMATIYPQISKCCYFVIVTKLRYRGKEADMISTWSTLFVDANMVSSYRSS